VGHACVFVTGGGSNGALFFGVREGASLARSLPDRFASAVFLLACSCAGPRPDRPFSPDLPVTLVLEEAAQERLMSGPLALFWDFHVLQSYLDPFFGGHSLAGYKLESCEKGLPLFLHSVCCFTSRATEPDQAWSRASSPQLGIASTSDES